MKIAFLTEFSTIGGGESNLLNLAKELSKTDEITLFCPKGRVFDEALSHGIKVIELNYIVKKRWILFIPIPGYVKSLIIELNKFDLIHVYSLNILPLVFFVKTPIIWTTHGYWEKPNGLRGIVINLIVDKVIAVSTDVFRISVVKNKKLIFLGAPIPDNHVNCKTFDQSLVTIACIGRFQKIKGQDLLLDAVYRLARESPETTFTVYFVGDVNSGSKIDHQFKANFVEKANNNKLGNLDIVLEGYKNDVSRYYQLCDFVVVPSLYESFSIVTVEALANGKPVIAPNIGGPKDIINTDRIGLLFEPGNVENLFKKIIFAINNFNKFNSVLCKKRALFFSIENQALKHLLLYKKVINEKN